MSKHAIILAGGKGTRLRPYTLSIPKPLMPISEYPILEIIIRQLASAGFNTITLAVNHQADIIKAYFTDGSKWGIKIDYSLENMPLNTMGPLKIIENLGSNFLVMNGDILTDLDFAKFFELHESRSAKFTISSYLRTQHVDYGVLHTTIDGKLLRLDEKPIMTYEVSMGVYMVSHDVLNHIPIGVSYGFDELMYDLLAKEIDVVVEKFTGYWLDIGRPEDYERAIDEFPSMRSRFLGE